MTFSRRWLTLLGALAVQAVVVGYGLATFTLWAGPWMSTFKASHGATMAAIMGSQIAAGIFAPLVAHVAGRVPVRLVMLGGVALFCAGLWLVSRATAMWQVTALYAGPIALGMTASGHMVGQILAVRLFQPNPGLAIGVVTLGLALGGLTVPPVVAGVLSVLGWRDAIALLSTAMAALCLLLITLTIREAKSGTPAVPSAVPRALSAARMLRDPTFAGATLTVTALTIGFNAIYFNLGPWMADLGVGAAGAAGIISATAIVAAAGIFGFGALADRVSPRALLTLALALEAAGMIAAAAGAGPTVLVLTVPLMGLATGGLIPLLAVILARRFGAAEFARANGLSLTITTFAVSGALLAGYGRDLLGSYPSAFRLILLTLAPAVFGILALPRANAVPDVSLVQER
jgi:MFS family permease